MPGYTVITLGCKVNQYESDAVAEALVRHGWIFSPDIKQADLILINTCAVTGKAGMQSRQAIRRACRENPAARIVVTGCYSQTDPEAVISIPGVSLILPQNLKYDVSVLTAYGTSPSCGPLPEQRAFILPEMPVMGTRTRPVLKIQDGCNAFCAYCIVPYARGPSRSMPVFDVLTHLAQLDRAKEVVLSGIHLGCYGRDLDPKTGLDQLIAHILEQNRPFRIRLSAIEPQELTEPLIDLIAGSTRICPHFHIPLQSGSDRILKAMNRPYRAADVLDKIHHIKTKMPLAAIGMDVMAGFPGEDETAFSETLSLIEAKDVTYLHVFPFSPRNGTRAAGFKNPVAPADIQRRCRQLRALGNRKKTAFFKQNIGKTAAVLVETALPDGAFKGFTENYIPVRLKSKTDLKNRVVSVRLEPSPGLGYMLGRVDEG